MLNVPAQVKDALKTDGTHKNFRIHFPNGEFNDITNEDLVSESVRFTESICSQDSFRFGLAESSAIEFETVGIGNMIGCTIDVSCEVGGYFSSTLTFRLTAAPYGSKTITISSIPNSRHINVGEVGSVLSQSQPTPHFSVSSDETKYVRNGGQYEVFEISNHFLRCEYQIVSEPYSQYENIWKLVNVDIFFDTSVSAFYNDYYTIPYGRFIVDKCPRNHENMAHRKVTAYTERLEKDFDIAGHYKNKNLTHYFNVLRDLAYLKTNDMDSVPVDETLDDVILNSNRTNFMYFNGIEYNKATIILKDIGTTCKSVIINADFNEIEYDNYETTLVNAILSSNVPSGYIYKQMTYSGSLVARRVYNDSKQADLFQYYPIPHYRIVFISNSAGTIATTYPMPIKPHVNIPISVENIMSAYGTINMSQVNIIKLEVVVPISYENKAIEPRIDIATVVHPYSGGNDTYYKINYNYWPVDVPSASYSIYRSGFGGTLYYKLYEIDEIDKFIIPSTGMIAKQATYLKTYYTYVNALDYTKFINGLLELNAQFMKSERDGTLETFNLSNTPQAYLLPSDYISLWWDEYNIEPIGTIKYAYKNTSGALQITEYNFGSGRSVYDMTDNYVLQNLYGASEEVINNLLDTYFIPHLSNIAFTPIDFSMRGLPYLEAGDLIDIESEDGIHVQSYIMVMDMNGIQNLEADITSTDGDTLYSEVTT